MFVIILSVAFLASPVFLAWVLTSRLTMRTKITICVVVGVIMLVSPVLMLVFGSGGPTVNLPD